MTIGLVVAIIAFLIADLIYEKVKFSQLSREYQRLYKYFMVHQSPSAYYQTEPPKYAGDIPIEPERDMNAEAYDEWRNIFESGVMTEAQEKKYRKMGEKSPIQFTDGVIQ